MEYQLIFSAKRKTIGLRIQQGKLSVRAPSFLSTQQVDSFVQTKKAWIEQKLAISTSKKPIPTLTYASGDKLFIQGEEKTLHLTPNHNENALHLQHGKVIIALTEQDFNADNRAQLIRTMLEHWCIEQTKQYVQTRLPYFEPLLGLYSKAIKVRVYKTRWGSCDSKQRLTFNALLAMVPRSVFDYVIVHELSHLKYMNHSAKFWQLVAAYQPNFHESRTWLKENQKKLILP